MKVGIIGGAGYTAGELIRLLIHHPAVDICFIHSKSMQGRNITYIHTDLVGETNLIFSSLYDLEKLDLLFLCSAHGESKQFIEKHIIPNKLKIIDLSMDFRHKKNAGDFIYGSPELNRESIIKAKYIANPGCFATAIQLALFPLTDKKIIKEEIHINAITGSTGAGVGLNKTAHFSWRNNNISIYKPFVHQHLQEISEALCYDLSKLNFIPIRGNFSRGIFASIYTRCHLSIQEIIHLYSNFYKKAAFTLLCDENPDLKQVINTNKCILYLEKYKDLLLIISIIDNLLKGASGQAVQNMNLMFGLNEKTGLILKANAF